MAMFGAFGRRRIERRVTQLAGEIARRSRQDVWHRVHHRIGPMSLAEARGYIRARAAEIVHDQTQAAMEQPSGVPARYRERLLDEATELVIQFVLADLLKLSQQHFLRHRRAAA
jgi:hypothetical protein